MYDPYFRKFSFLFVFAFFSFSSLLAGKYKAVVNPEVYEKLDFQKAENIACKRPSLKEGLMTRIEKGPDDTHLIISNYGHAGYGFSNGPGATHRLHKAFLEKEGDLSSEIAVIGNGLIGRWTAYFLKNSGFSNITIYCQNLEESESIPSFNATGIFSPNLTNPENKEDALETCRLYFGLPEDIRSTILETITFFSTGPFGLEVVPFCKLLDSDAQLTLPNSQTLPGFLYESFSINTKTLLGFLADALKDVPIVPQSVDVDFFSKSRGHIFDCSGLGIRTPPQESHGVFGHHVRIPLPLSFFPLTIFSEEEQPTLSPHLSFYLGGGASEDPKLFPFEKDKSALNRYLQIVSHTFSQGGHTRLTLAGTGFRVPLIEGILKHPLNKAYHTLEGLLVLLRFYEFINYPRLDTFKEYIRTFAKENRLEERLWEEALKGGYIFSSKA
ncbi:MAG: hypothetical protein JSS34_05400 [Proteobacteria bacterium]|nr:hypothetical protein [Pseudomonadota bacterium]